MVKHAVTIMTLCFASPLLAQSPSASGATSAPPATQQSQAASSPAQSIGMFAYPKKEQTADQQLKDENECFASAKQQSGIDPQAPPPATKTERSEEHTSELQSRLHLVCRLLLEKKKIDPRHEQRVPHSTRSELDTTLRVIVS